MCVLCVCAVCSGWLVGRSVLFACNFMKFFFAMKIHICVPFFMIVELVEVVELKLVIIIFSSFLFFLSHLFVKHTNTHTQTSP